MQIKSQGGAVKLVRQLPPDAEGTACEEVFTLTVEEAHQVLTTSALREALAQAKAHARDAIMSRAMKLEEEAKRLRDLCR
jgi:hypothetical protein